MSTLNLEKVKIKNFLSFGSSITEFDLKSGINLVTGLNLDTGRKNGTGKSSLFLAIIWGLYGKVLKEITKDQIVNWKNKKKCLVEVQFTIDNDSYEIQRGIKPNLFLIKKNGSELDQLSSVNDFQDYLENEILKINYKTFISLFYYNPNNFESIFDIPKAQKRKFLENLFNLEIYTEIKDKLNKKISNFESEILKNETEISSNVSSLSSLNTILNQYNTDIKQVDVSTSKLEELQEKLNEIDDNAINENELIEFQNGVNIAKNRIQKIDAKFLWENKKFKELSFNENASQELKEIQELLLKCTQEPEKEKSLYDTRIQIQTKISSLKEELTKTQTKGKYEDLDICPICGSKMDNESIREHKAKEKIRIEFLLNEEKTRFSEIDKQYSEIVKNNEFYLDRAAISKNLILQIEENKNFIRKKKIVDILYEKLSKNKENLKSLEISLKSLQAQLQPKKEILLKEIEFEEQKLQERHRQIEKLEAYKVNAKAEINLLSSSNIELTKKNKKINTLKEYCTYIKKLCADDKVKQYAISNLIPIINSKVNYYLSESGMPFYVKFDSWLDCEIRGAGIANATVGNLSGGEKKSLELALQFALSDITKLKCKNLPNLLILDEILDSSVDSEGIANLMRIISVKQKEENLACFIISHRKEIGTFTFSNTYVIKKSNGYSNLK